MKCSVCGTENSSNSHFCLKCGAKISPSDPGSIAPHQGEQQLTPAGAPIPSQVEVPTPTQSGLGPVHRPPQPAFQPTGTSVVSLWGPFAGYGTRRKHEGWLMDGRGERVPDLINNVNKKFQERKIPEARVIQKTLTARGLLVERRSYFLVQRGIVSVGLYINQFGRDLYVSLASYLKPPLSNFRMIVVGLMLLFAVFSVIAIPIMSRNLAGGMENILFGGAGEVISQITTFLCCFGPIASLDILASIIFIIYSLYKYITEKDILAGLRTKTNEFNEDDLMAIEKAVEQTVRISIDEIGLNPDDLKPVSTGNAGWVI